MRTAHILIRNSDGKASISADGDYAAVREKYETAKVPDGGTVEFWSKLGIKIKKGAPKAAPKSKEKDEK